MKKIKINFFLVEYKYIVFQIKNIKYNKFLQDFSNDNDYLKQEYSLSEYCMDHTATNIFWL